MPDATTLSGLLTQRATAGSRYAAAVTELRAAYIDLAAIDRTLGSWKSDLDSPVPTFPTESPQGVPDILRHPTYAAGPGPNSTPRWEGDVAARTAQLLAGF